MFAKLKKKIKEEGGVATDTNLSPAGPGIASPVRKDGVGSPSGRTSGRLFNANTNGSGEESSISSSNGAQEEGGSKDGGTKEEVLSLLMKRTEQVKKLEGKISEFAATIKEKNKTIEKLETNLEKEKQDNERKIEEMSHEHSQNEEKMRLKFEEEVGQKEIEIKAKLRSKFASLEKERSSLEKKLKEANAYKDRYFKKEEESDEFQDLTKQELAKVKHMLLNTQEDLLACESRLKEKMDECENMTKQMKDLENEVETLKLEVDFNNLDREKMDEEKQKLFTETNKFISSITSLENQISSLKQDLQEKCTSHSSMEQTLAHLQDEHQTLQRNSDVYKNKTVALLSEKDEHITHLQERVDTLEQRLEDSGLSGDEQAHALKKERDILENKLTEARQQLTDIKTTWSDKITHLEEQISHLNTKIVEDSEELMSSQRAAETMREGFQRQIEDLQCKLEEAEKRGLEGTELANIKEIQLEKQKHNWELELKKAQQHASNMEKDLREKNDALQSRLNTLQKTFDSEKSAYQQKITHLENTIDDSLAKEIETEKQITQLEDQKQALKNDLTAKERECNQTKHQLEFANVELVKMTDLKNSTEEDLLSHKEQSESLQKSVKSKQQSFSDCKKEKDEFMMRNAELSQQLETIRRSSTADIQDLQRALRDSTEELSSVREQLIKMEEKMKDLESERESVFVNIETEEIAKYKKATEDLEEQLAEKTKTIKMQQQRLTDLKKTLQRELKVQSLPNDEPDAREPEPSVPKPNQNRSDPKVPPNKSALNSNNFDIDYYNSHPMPSSMKLDMGPEVNFKYLKHVVLKFMLSRESEAIHLVKAISTLLRFNREEQALIRETLEWKMSWFGSKPALGKGQSAKIIPSS
ncbi:golgin subfamily A member 1-like isoform X2 [Lineus longissimus]|uniref:golgin subfamily A member 1-like isoform X2 n=1 Tax=Lineus longissimus TaxID=88925 RepID=UPI00315D046F